MTDYISRADAINAVHKYFVDKINDEPHEIDEDGDDCSWGERREE